MYHFSYITNYSSYQLREICQLTKQKRFFIMSITLPEKKEKNIQLSMFKNDSFYYKEDFLIIGNQKSIDKIKENDYLTEIFYKNLH